jgi:glycine oxidase
VGARRNGWLLGPLSARILVACVTGADPGAYGALLHPGRFSRG